MGVTTMKMIRSTRQTSTSGVTLMSDVRAAWLSLPSELTLDDRFVIAGSDFLHEVDGHLRSGVRHLDGEAVDAVLEVVVCPHRGDGHEEAAGGGEERFCDTGRDRGDAAARLGHAFERADDAHDRAEETDERRGGADGRENTEV